MTKKTFSLVNLSFLWLDKLQKISHSFYHKEDFKSTLKKLCLNILPEPIQLLYNFWFSFGCNCRWLFSYIWLQLWSAKYSQNIESVDYFSNTLFLASLFTFCSMGKLRFWHFIFYNRQLICLAIILSKELHL